MNKSLAWKSDYVVAGYAVSKYEREANKQSCTLPPGCLGRKKPSRKHLATLKHSLKMQPIIILFDLRSNVKGQM